MPSQSRISARCLSYLLLILGAAACFGPAAASAADYLTPEESLARMELPEGFRANLFAHEPDIVKVIAMAWDERGRLYVLECLEYPNGAPPGTKPRDRIKILEDTDGDGKVDKVTIFADGLDLATGMQVGYGGVFVGAAPYLYFLKDSDGDDVADTREVLLEGFGRQDTHEMLNSFIWGPDGWLYGCHGVFTYSNVQGIPFSAAIWRYHPRAKKFEIFAEGTSNPWGFDYNAVGSSFLEACVIPHLFHMVPGGLYIRQAGQNTNPYAYGQIREISDHVHYYGVTPHAGNNDPRSGATGGGHAHSGLLCYLGDNFPEEYRGSLFMGNIHGNRVNRDLLVRRGSSYVGKHAPDFLKANDRNFRALNTQLGPDGSLYQLDWHESFPCHNTNPDAWTRDHGRIYRVTYTGDKPLEPRKPQRDDAARGGDLSKLSSAELVEFLNFPNAWQSRMANRILAERQDRSVVPALQQMALEEGDEERALHGLWALDAVGGFDEPFARKTLAHQDPWVRAWTVRFLGELGSVSTQTLKQLVRMAAADPSPDVRLQLAST